MRILFGLALSLILTIGSGPGPGSGDAWLEYSEGTPGRQDATAIFVAAGVPFFPAAGATLPTAFDGCTDTVTVYLHGGCPARTCYKATLSYRTTHDDTYAVLHWPAGAPAAPWGAAGSQYAWDTDWPANTQLTLHLSPDGC